ncbi:hypothetical protein EYF80_065885 [Liparis tanakae]|uniref:Uncharacterized protein n=1 Tax=Liparis tanakae TaxID=230148 RepID=A0A4Z2E5W1_9TELE|nr:hypothetical protein EYF80_065885 [Liparis tanakae]
MCGHFFLSVTHLSLSTSKKGDCRKSPQAVSCPMPWSSYRENTLEGSRRTSPTPGEAAAIGSMRGGYGQRAGYFAFAVTFADKLFTSAINTWSNTAGSSTPGSFRSTRLRKFQRTTPVMALEPATTGIGAHTILELSRRLVQARDLFSSSWPHQKDPAADDPMAFLKDTAFLPGKKLLVFFIISCAQQNTTQRRERVPHVKATLCNFSPVAPPSGI